MLSEEQQKWIWSAVSAVVFVLLASPFMFQATNYLGEMISLPTVQDGSPTLFGLALHGVVFALLVRLLMWVGDLWQQKKDAPQ